MHTATHVEPKWTVLLTIALGYFAVQLAMTSVPPLLPTLAQLFESVNNTAIMSSVPGTLRGFAAGMSDESSLDESCQ
jgi:hypothetical protein